MKLFGKKKQQEAIDDRTGVERSFEEKGQEFGKKAGEIAQKGINKFKDVAEKVDAEGKLNKVDEMADKAIKKSKDAAKKVYDKNFKKEKDE